MGYTSFGQFLKWIEAPSGINSSTRRQELVTMANRIRQHIYLLYESVPMFLDVEECIEVQEFCENCHDCESVYTGIALPRAMETPEAIFVNSEPIPMYSVWREYRDGRKYSQANTKSYDMGTIWSTERDICPCGVPMRLSFAATSPVDCGKIVTLRYRTPGMNETFTETIKLSTQPVLTGRDVQSIESPGGVMLPTDLASGVIFAQEDGRILSLYGTGQHVPNFRRLKLPDLCVGTQVFVKAARKYIELSFDNDVVETDNRPAVEAFARSFRFLESTEAGVAYEQKAAYHEAIGRKYLLGEKSRENGKNVVKQQGFHGKIRRSRLSTKR